MVQYIINSKIYGKQVFVCDEKYSYVFLNGRQIRDGGSRRGSTIMANAASLKYVANRWWSNYLRQTKPYR